MDCTAPYWKFLYPGRVRRGRCELLYSSTVVLPVLDSVLYQGVSAMRPKKHRDELESPSILGTVQVQTSRRRSLAMNSATRKAHKARIATEGSAAGPRFRKARLRCRAYCSVLYCCVLICTVMYITVTDIVFLLHVVVTSPCTVQ